MLDNIENKLIDKLNTISITTIKKLFDCDAADVDNILNKYFAKRDYFKGDINISYTTKIKTLGKIRRIDGGLSIHYSNMESLGELRIVNGSVHISGSSIESTGKLIYCTSLYVFGKNFKKINKLAEVNGDLTLYGTSIVSLNKLRVIGKNLKLQENENLLSLGSLTNVHGDLVITRCPNLNTLGKVYCIDGSLDVRYGDLKSFGNLIELNGFVVTLKSKVKNLYDSDLEILDLKPLLSIIPNMKKLMSLTVPKIDNLTNFNMIIIDDDK